MDLRFVNKHVWKQKGKFEDLKVALSYFDKGHFMFSFEIRALIIMCLSSRPTRHFWVFPGFNRVRSVIFVLGSCPSASIQPFCFRKDF